MIRICYVVPSLSLGGTERQLTYLIAGLIRDFEITVICTDHVGALAADIRRMGAFVHSIGVHGGWDFRAKGRFEKNFKMHRPDIMHTYMFGFDYYANKAARNTGVPVIISSRRQLATWKKGRHKYIQKKANKLVDLIVANSKAGADFAAKQEGISMSRFKIIPNGVDVEKFISKTDPRHIKLRYRIPQDKKIIGIVANFTNVKDHMLFVNISEELLRRRSDLHFLMVGLGPTRKKIEEEIEVRGMANNFTPASTLEELADLYSIMSVSVLCSKAEGFPNVVLESMAAGAPVVASAVGGVPELINHGETGRLVNSREATDFADEIEAVLNDFHSVQSMARRATQFVSENMSVEKMVASYRKIYTDMLATTVQEG